MKLIVVFISLLMFLVGAFMGFVLRQPEHEMDSGSELAVFVFCIMVAIGIVVVEIILI